MARMKDSTAPELIEAATEAIQTVVLVGGRAVKGFVTVGKFPLPTWLT